MNEKEYYQRSSKEKLPKRCPILNYCERRAFTIYCYSDYEKFARTNNIVLALQKEGVIPMDFEQKAINIQGESPMWHKSDVLIYYHDMCPEVNLFDYENSLPFAKGLASTDGEWDDFRKNIKFVNQKNKHFSECTEFNKYLFENNILNTKKTSSSRRRSGISQKLRFEIYSRDKFTCQYCGRVAGKDGVVLEIDHKIPVSEGGTDDYNNLITSCKECNQGKSNKII